MKENHQRTDLLAFSFHHLERCLMVMSNRSRVIYAQVLTPPLLNFRYSNFGLWIITCFLCDGQTARSSSLGIAINVGDDDDFHVLCQDEPVAQRPASTGRKRKDVEGFAKSRRRVPAVSKSEIHLSQIKLMYPKVSIYSRREICWWPDMMLYNNNKKRPSAVHTHTETL